MRIEDEALLLAARVTLAPQQQSALAGLLCRPLDWEYLAATAAAHGVAPLLYRHLPAGNGVPSEARERLRHAAGAAALQGIQAAAQLGEILPAAERAGLPLLLLKGSALVQSVYGGRCIRPMSDIDLLVPPDALPLAETVFARLGYTASLPQARFGRSLERLADGVQYRRDGAALHLDVQWGLVPLLLRPLLPADAAGVWQRAQPLAVAGGSVHALGPEDLLLYLCIHHFSHGGQALLGFCDIAETVRQLEGRLCWETVVTRASEWRADAIAACWLAWARRHLAAPVPADVIAALAARHGLVDPDVLGAPVTSAELLGDRGEVTRRQLFFMPARQRVRWMLRSVFLPLGGVGIGTGRPAWASALYLVSPARLGRGAGILARMARSGRAQ